MGCNDFTKSQGDAFCRANGMRSVSLDSPSKEAEFKGLVAREGQRFFWTGGSVSGRNIRWPSGRRHNNVEWSHTGGYVVAEAVMSPKSLKYLGGIATIIMFIAALAVLSLTTGRVMSHAWRCSTTSTTMGSSSTTWPATTESRSSARAELLREELWRMEMAT